MTPLNHDIITGLTGRSCWIVSDGKAGHEAQSVGVAEALGLDVTMKPVAPQGLVRTFAPYLPVAKAEGFGTPDSPFHAPWPDIAIGTGRLTVPYMRQLKRAAGDETFTVILLDPKFGYATADLVWIPAHDLKSGENVISTLTPPHRHSPSSLALLRDQSPPFSLSTDKVHAVVLLGGPNGRHAYDRTTIKRFIESLRSLIKCNVQLLATGSRRTPPDLEDAVRRLVEDSDGYYWDGAGDNPIAHFYARGDLFVVPADSINMVAEACVTGKPVFVFHPKGGAEKFTRFHTALEKHGATRPLPKTFSEIPVWSYPPLYAAEDIAQHIVRRWAASQRGQ